jgi:hypothetical protein
MRREVGTAAVPLLLVDGLRFIGGYPLMVTISGNSSGDSAYAIVTTLASAKLLQRVLLP